MSENENPIQAPGNITPTEGGGYVAEGKAAVDTVRYMTIRRALKFEIETGMRMTRIPIVPALQRMGVTTARSKRKAYTDLDRAMVEAGYESLPLTK